MRATKQVQKILSYYEGENAVVKGQPLPYAHGGQAGRH